MRIPFLPRMISEFSRFLTGIEIHPGAVSGCRVIIDQTEFAPNQVDGRGRG